MKRAITGFGVDFSDKSPNVKTHIWTLIRRIDAMFRESGIDLIEWWVYPTSDGLVQIKPLFPADQFPEAMTVWNHALDRLDEGMSV